MEYINYLSYYIFSHIEKISITHILLYYGIACIITAFLEWHKKSNYSNKISWHMISLSLLLIFLMTIAGRETIDVPFNLKSIFNTYNMIGKTYWWNILFEIILNVILFVPLGMSLSKEYSFKDTILLSATISFAIETVQLISRIGVFEICDIIHNSIGASAGYLILQLKKEIKK